MAYINVKGEEQYTLKEKIAYHENCINTGKDADGKKLTPVQIHNHTRAYDRLKRQLNGFMRSVNAVDRVNNLRKK